MMEFKEYVCHRCKTISQVLMRKEGKAHCTICGDYDRGDFTDRIRARGQFALLEVGVTYYFDLEVFLETGIMHFVRGPYSI